MTSKDIGIETMFTMYTRTIRKCSPWKSLLTKSVAILPFASGERNPGDDDYEIMFNRATQRVEYRPQTNMRRDNSGVIMFLMGVVAFGGFLAYGTVQ
jgi:hypothetical protein